MGCGSESVCLAVDLALVVCVSKSGRLIQILAAGRRKPHLGPSAEGPSSGPACLVTFTSWDVSEWVV